MGGSVVGGGGGRSSSSTLVPSSPCTGFTGDCLGGGMVPVFVIIGFGGRAGRNFVGVSGFDWLLDEMGVDDNFGGEKIDESAIEEIGVPYPGLLLDTEENTGATDEIGFPREIGIDMFEETIELSV